MRERRSSSTTIQIVSTRTVPAVTDLIFDPNISKLVGYTRFSTYEQLYGGFSTQRQTEKILEYAAERNQRLWRTYSDEAVTGTTIDRPQWNRMMHDLRPYPGSIILMERVSRAARANDVFTDAVRQAAEIKARIIYVTMGEVDQDTVDHAAHQSTTQHHEQNKLMRDGRLVAVKRGIWMGPVPAGYRKTTGKHLVVDE